MAKTKFSFADYSTAAATFAAYKDQVYPFLALPEEVGEFLSVQAKTARGDYGEPKDMDAEMRYELAEKAIKEAGDVLWQLDSCLREMGLSLEYVAQRNIEKLTKRKEDGTIKGSGDNR